MIKINLLPAEQYEKRKRRALSAALLAVPLVTFILVGGFYVKNVRDVARLAAENTDLGRQRASLDSVRREFLALQEQKKDMAQRIAVIDRIKQGRGLAAKMLYDLSTLTTRNLWIKRLRKDETRLDLEGRSIDNESICAFVEALSALPYMKDVELRSVEDVTETGVTVKKFLVAGSVAS